MRLALTPALSCTAQVFDGDIPYLYKQSRNNRLAFKNATGNDWVKEYFLPGQSDRCADALLMSDISGYLWYPSARLHVCHCRGIVMKTWEVVSVSKDEAQHVMCLVV